MCNSDFSATDNNMQLTMLSYGMENHQIGADHMHYHFGRCHARFPSAPRSESTWNGLEYLWRVVKGMQSDCANVLLLDTGETLQSGFQMARIGHYKGIRYKICIQDAIN